MFHLVHAVVWAIGLGGLALAGSALAEQAGSGSHLAVPGTISEIRSGVLFVAIPFGSQPRVVSRIHADRVGLHEARVGDQLTLWVDEGNVLSDVHAAGFAGHRHRIIAGRLNYADQFWSEIKLSTPEGTERFEVDALAGSKLSMMREGAPVTVELDEDNVVIDIHRGH
jgi:hypothetical protein